MKRKQKERKKAKRKKKAQERVLQRRAKLRDRRKVEEALEKMRNEGIPKGITIKNTEKNDDED